MMIRKHLRTVRQATVILGCSIAVFRTLQAANQTWDGGSVVDGFWETVANWLGNPTPPGNTSSPNSDVATFNAPIANTWGNSAANPIVLGNDRYIGGINFDGAAGSYFIGSTGGNALRVNTGGAIQVLSTLTATNATFTINAPLVDPIGPPSYSFRNNSASGTGPGSGTLKIGGEVLAFQLTIAGTNTNANTISGQMNFSTLTKSGAGTWTLTAANLTSDKVSIDGGTLVLAFGTVSADILGNGFSPLEMAGGTLQLTGTGTQTMLGLSTTDNTASRIIMGANQTLTLGSLGTIGANSALNFNTAAGGANASTSTLGTGVVVLSGPTAGAAISPGFTVTDAGGFGLATVNGSNQVVRLTTTTLLPASGASAGTNYRVNNNAGGSGAAGSSNLAITASQSANSITVDTTTAAGVVTLNSGVLLTTSTWNFGGVGSNPWQITGSAGGAGIRPALNTPLYFNNYNASPVTINTPILSNGANDVYVRGTGTLILSAANTYGGYTYVQGGALEVTTGGSINNGSNFYVASGPGNTATFNLTGGSVTNVFGVVGLGAGSNATANISSGTWTNQYLGVGAGSDNEIAVMNITGTGTVTVTDVSGVFLETNSTINLGTGGVAGTLNASQLFGEGATPTLNFNHTGDYNFGVFLTGTLRINKLGPGKTVLSNTNNYTGPTTVSAGTLLVAGSISGSSTTVTGAGSTLGGTGTVGAVTVGSGSILQGGDGLLASGALSSGGNITLNDNSVIRLTLGGGGTHSSLARSGGTWVFDNNQAFQFTLAPGAATGFYNNIISGLLGTETGLATIGTWLITSSPGVIGTFTYDGTGNVDLTLSAIPEPGTAALLLAGLPLAGLRRWRRK